MPAQRRRRRRTDRLSISRLTPSAQNALALIEREPGISVEDLSTRLNISLGRAWQLVSLLQYGRVRLNRDFAAERARRAASRK